MKSKSAWIARFGVLVALACGRSPEAELAVSSAARMPGDRIEFSGTADAFGHPMLPAGAGGECEVHHVELQDDLIVAFAGFPYISAPGFEEAERTQFPRSATIFESGCDAERYGMVAVSFCVACREARDAWEQAAAAAGHPHPYTEVQRRERVANGGR